ncbi:MAG: ferredoxin--NADP reductase, partial [Hyphomicrobium sp.]
GTLLITNLRSGRNLWLFATGTGFAPFASIIRDPETYANFEKVIVVEGCRHVAELQFSDQIIDDVLQHEYLGDLSANKLFYYPTITREAFKHSGRIPDLIVSGKLFSDTQMSPLDHELDRIMICGNPEMLSSLKQLVEGYGFKEGSNSAPGDFVIEKAFVEK